MQLRRIEEAALNAWPALQQLLYDGWIARFADGYTKRANSVTPLYPASQELYDNIAFFEQVYVARHLPVVFRLPSFTAPPGLDGLLAERGYRRADETLVLARALDAEAQQLVDGSLHTLPPDEWLPLYSHLYGASLHQQQIHRALLEAILGVRALFVLRAGGEVVACGLGVQEGMYFGLFDIVTAPALRGRGYGTQLVGGMLKWARNNGAGYAYLQVVGANTPARRVYDRLGFKESYRYWYRISEL